eukprot:6067902-Pyramimonas_sp.AAC.1
MASSSLPDHIHHRPLKRPNLVAAALESAQKCRFLTFSPARGAENAAVCAATGGPASSGIGRGSGGGRGYAPVHHPLPLRVLGKANVGEAHRGQHPQVPGGLASVGGLVRVHHPPLPWGGLPR